MTEDFTTKLRLSLLFLIGFAELSLAGPLIERDQGSPLYPQGHYDEGNLNDHPIPGWWDEGKFGIFIHWGPYAVPAHGAKTDFQVVVEPSPGQALHVSYLPAEWYFFGQQFHVTQVDEYHEKTFGRETTYNDFIRDFRAENFYPDEWIDLFKKAGAKYFVLTAKHHDGFALWDSIVSGRNAYQLGPNRDLVKELFDAAERADNAVKPGLYYSMTEFFNPAKKEHDGHIWNGFNGIIWSGKAWENPYLGIENVILALFGQGKYLDYLGQPPSVQEYVTDLVRPQLRELITTYKPYVIWCDIGGDDDYFRSGPVLADYYNMAELHRPEGVIVNNRCGDDHTHRDYEVVEQGAGAAMSADVKQRSETAVTIGRSWGYDKTENDANVDSADSLIRRLAQAVAHNSNFLLNIGPRSDGSIPDYVKQRLLDIGEWLVVNGQSIYQTRPFFVSGQHFVDPNGSVFTEGKDGAVYLHAVNLARGDHNLTISYPRGTKSAPALRLVADSGLESLAGSTSWFWDWGDKTVRYRIPGSLWEKAPDTGHLVFVVEGM